MRGLTSLFSRIAGIVATIIGAVSIVGLVVMIIELGFVADMIKPIVMCLLFFISGIVMIKSKHGIGHVIGCIVMLIVIILERFVWVGGIFAFTEMALALIFESVDVITTFAKYYEIILYVLMACSIVAMICRIIALSINYGEKE